MNSYSIKVRYIVTMGTNVLRGALTFATGLIIARNLGAADFGNFNFLVGSFTALISLINMQSDAAFFTLLSRKPRGKKFFLFFTVLTFTQLFILLSLTLFSPDFLKQQLWLGLPTDLLLLALLSSFTMILIWKILGNAGESIRDTIGVQVRNLVLAVLYILCVLALAKLNIFSIKNLLVLNIVLHFSLAIVYIERLSRLGLITSQPHENFKNIAREFKDYCLPLLSATLLLFVYSFVDFWLLQKFGGSVAQGHYAVGARFAAVAQIATVSILKIFWKEIAEAHANGDMEKVRRLHQRVSKSLIFISAVISCVLIPFCDEILLLVLGPSYREAAVPLSIMLLFPIYQSMGQISGVMVLAMKETKVKNALDVFNLTTHIIAAYFVLAPGNLLVPGFELGATGLALKMVFVSAIHANLVAFFVARKINVAFDWRHPLFIVGTLLPLGFACKFAAQETLGTFFSGNTQTLVTGGSAGLLYLIGAASLVYFYPTAAGINRDQVHQWVSGLRKQYN